MFGNRNQQLADLEEAYKFFIGTVRGLSMEGFFKSLGDWNPRDILAHFIGWNRITLVGCAEIREGVEPFYFHDETNDYRKVSARFIEQFNSTNRETLLLHMASTKDTLIAYRKTLEESEWEQDAGIIHYRGGPATVARCGDSLIRDYRKHCDEIISGNEK